VRGGGGGSVSRRGRGSEGKGNESGRDEEEIERKKKRQKKATKLKHSVMRTPAQQIKEKQKAKEREANRESIRGGHTTNKSTRVPETMSISTLTKTEKDYVKTRE
jgi:hypothetical protein